MLSWNCRGDQVVATCLYSVSPVGLWPCMLWKVNHSNRCLWRIWGSQTEGAHHCWARVYTCIPYDRDGNLNCLILWLNQFSIISNSFNFFLPLLLSLWIPHSWLHRMHCHVNVLSHTVGTLGFPAAVIKPWWRRPGALGGSPARAATGCSTLAALLRPLASG